MAESARRPGFITAFILIGFSLLYFGVRVPYYSHPIIGEEGLFADLFYAQPPGPDKLLLAKINGEEIYTAFNHPVPPYSFLAAIGKITNLVIPNSALDEVSKVRLIRFVFSLFQYAVDSD